MRAVLRAGALYTYLTKLPLLGDVSEVSIAYLSSLQVCPSTAMLMLGRALSLSFTSSLFHSLLHSFTHCFTPSLIASLTCVQELTVASDEGGTLKLKLPVEPSSVAVDEFYAACGMNNSAWFYVIDNGTHT